MISIYMDLRKPLTQDNYDEAVRACLKNPSLTCSCGAVGLMAPHAHYQRWYIDRDNGESSLVILRLICKSCGKTHALLPIQIIPYRQHSHELILDILNDYRCLNSTVSMLSKKYLVSIEYVRSLITDYWHDHKARLDILLADHYFLDFFSLEFFSAYHLENCFFFMQRVSTLFHRICFKADST